MFKRGLLAWATFWVVSIAGGLLVGILTLSWQLGLAVFAVGIVLVVVQVVLLARKGHKAVKEFMNEPPSSLFSDKGTGWPGF